MKVNKEIRNIWNKEYEHGDIQAAAKVTGLSDMTISRAINTGICSKRTFDKINEFFLNKKMSLVKESKDIVSKFQMHDQD